MIELRRFEGIITQKDMLPVTVIGAGGIGSALIKNLVQMGAPVAVYDDDVVALVNRGTQGFANRHMDMRKVDAMEDVYNDYGHEQGFLTHYERVTDAKILNTPIVMLTVDSIDARKEIFNSLPPQVRYVIDGRMAAEIGQVYFVDRFNAVSEATYKKTIFPQEEAVPLPCTEKATIYCGNFIGSLMTAIYKSTCIYDKKELNTRTIPSLVSFDLRTFNMDTEYVK